MGRTRGRTRKGGDGVYFAFGFGVDFPHFWRITALVGYDK